MPHGNPLGTFKKESRVAASYLNRGKMVRGSGVPVALLPAIVLMRVNGRPLVATPPVWTVPVWHGLGTLALDSAPGVRTASPTILAGDERECPGRGQYAGYRASITVRGA
jgi:hypothetical protein